MRALVFGGGAVLLAACTLLVPIDDDLTSGGGGGTSKPDGGDSGRTIVDGGSSSSGSSSGETGSVDPIDSGDLVGPPRDGCPNGVSLDPDLAAYYPFDETAGSILHDCSLKANDLPSLTAVVPKWSADGHIHGAADFDGVDGCFAATDPSLNSFENQPFSVSVWFFARQLFDAANNTGLWIVSHKVSPRGWHVGVDDPNRAELDLEWHDSADHKSQTSAIAETGVWTHFATTYSPTGEAAVYKNGVLTDKKSGASMVPSQFNAPVGALFKVGCRGSKSGTFDGKIDELRIYPRVLTEDEIRKLAGAP